ncbi:galactose-1-epimerase [Piscinibacter sp.]|uniref:galactose-1-epimerase n=1 Tax=Piscinibacter sp. TaxID=1903157 RepID=UPI0035599448
MPAAHSPPTVLRLRSPKGLTLTLMDEGATWLSCEVPLPDGSCREVLLGCATPQAYARQTAYLGATIGRYANRIAQARIAHDGRAWSLVPNPGSRHQLHGGPQGFHRRRWTIAEASDSVACFTLESPDGDQGYPGQLQARVCYQLLGDHGIEMDCEARVSAPSPVCLTNHAYFNLDAVHADVRSHRLQIAAEHYLPVDADLIPLGALAPVQGRGFDFRQPKTLAKDWMRDAQQRHGAGYDHAFLLDRDCAGLRSPAAVLRAADASLSLRVYSTLPALQLYAGQFLAGIESRDGTPYPPCAGVALEPQFLPDSPNHPEWPQPSSWLMPGDTYRHTIRYEFVVG